MEKGVSASLQEHGMTISQSGQDVTSKKQAGEEPTAGNGDQVSMLGCTNGLQGYCLDDDEQLNSMLGAQPRQKPETGLRDFLEKWSL